MSKEFLDIQATIEYGFTLKRIHHKKNRFKRSSKERKTHRTKRKERRTDKDINSLENRTEEKKKTLFSKFQNEEKWKKERKKKQSDVAAVWGEI